MNKTNSKQISTVEARTEDGSRSTDDDTRGVDGTQPSQTHISRLSSCSTNSNSTTTTTTTNNGTRRHKDISPCYVCGAKANGYNFDQITCESCKAFFRRNALKSMDKFRCRNNDNCVITSLTRKRCKRCRLAKCFKVGMRKEWILTDEEKSLKRQKIAHNRMIKQQAHLNLQRQQQQINGLSHSQLPVSIKPPDKSLSTIEQPLVSPSPMVYIKSPTDQHLYERHHFLLNQLSDGYQFIIRQYPQPQKLAHRNRIIYETENFEIRLHLIKDLTRELTQMTILRLLHYFNIIPEFQLLAPDEKQSVLTQNMLAVFMFHGALTYNPDDDTCVDKTTEDEPFDAKNLLYVYGPKVYHKFVALAKGLTTVAYPALEDKRSMEHTHTLYLLLMVILLFSKDYQIQILEDNPSKLNKIQQSYIDIACRFLRDRFGLTNARRMFLRLVPFLMDLQKLCSTLAHVKLCESADDDDRSSPSRSAMDTTTATPMTTENRYDGHLHPAPDMANEFERNSAMIRDTSQLNEVQKENQGPTPPSTFNSTLSSPNTRSAPTVLSNTTTTFQNY